MKRQVLGVLVTLFLGGAGCSGGGGIYREPDVADGGSDSSNSNTADADVDSESISDGHFLDSDRENDSDPEEITCTSGAFYCINPGELGRCNEDGVLEYYARCESSEVCEEGSCVPALIDNFDDIPREAVLDRCGFCDTVTINYYIDEDSFLPSNCPGIRGVSNPIGKIREAQRVWEEGTGGRVQFVEASADEAIVTFICGRTEEECDDGRALGCTDMPASCVEIQETHKLIIIDERDLPWEYWTDDLFIHVEAHELGHILGLDHSPNWFGDLMSPFASRDYPELKCTDLQLFQGVWGNGTSECDLEYCIMRQTCDEDCLELFPSDVCPSSTTCSDPASACIFSSELKTCWRDFCECVVCEETSCGEEGECIDGECRGTCSCEDRDGDGHYPEGTCSDTYCEPRDDCDDGNSRRNRGLSEVLDGVDNDCNGVVDDDFCPRNYCYDRGYTSGRYCRSVVDGLESVSCGARDFCSIVLDLIGCSYSCDLETGLCVCEDNYCQNNGYSSGSHCDGRAVVSCGLASDSCRIESSRTTCSEGEECRSGSCTDVSPTEICDGRDNDGDGICDNGFGFSCCAGGTASCETRCDSVGLRTCSAVCSWGECIPPPERCNGRDDNCDGHIDEDCTPDCDSYHCAGPCTMVEAEADMRRCGSGCSLQQCMVISESCGICWREVDNCCDGEAGCSRYSDYYLEVHESSDEYGCCHSGPSVDRCEGRQVVQYTDCGRRIRSDDCLECEQVSPVDIDCRVYW